MSSEYIKIQEWQLREIQAGLAEADAGELVSHESVMKKWEAKFKNLLVKS